MVAEVESPDKRDVKVVEKLWGNAPEGTAEVLNLPDARGFTQPGRYLLFLHPSGGAWAIVGHLRSPGTSEGGTPLIYPWTDDVRKQAESLKK